MNIPNFITNPDPNIFLSDNYLTLDFETTNHDKGSALNRTNSILLAVWRKRGKARNIHRTNEYELRNLIEDIQDVDFVVAHNAKFELQWLKRCGLDLSQVLVFDTQIAEYVLMSNTSNLVDLALGKVAKKRGFGIKDPFIDICMKAGVATELLPVHWLEDRCAKDVRQTESVFLAQREELKERDQLKTLFTRCIFTPVLADIEFNGMCLDGEKVEKTYREFQNRLNNSVGELEELTGGINMRSTKQLGEFLYGSDGLGFSELKDRRGKPLRTSKDKPRTDTATLSSLKPRNKRQRTFLNLRQRFGKVNAAITKNLAFFYGVVKERGRIFYGQFNQTVTATQRLSASGRTVAFEYSGKSHSVQFQNMPREFKSLFRARKDGWKIGEIDGSQLEFRVAAHLGRDVTATEAIRTGFDVHTFTAETITAAGQPTDRQTAKGHTFKPLFGGSSGTEAEQAYYEAFKKRYEGIAAAQQSWIDTVLVEKELTIPSGLTFYWPATKMTKTGYVTNTPSICNYPVQSYATADIIPIAITKLWHEMKARNLQSFLVNTIHDSGIMEVCPEEIDVIKDISFEAFTDYVYYYLDKVYDDQFTVPLGAELKIGSHWNSKTSDVYEHSIEPPTIQEAA